jgi:hypothetical protein
MEERSFWLQVRQGLLFIIAAIESRLKIEPSTSDLRKWWKQGIIEREQKFGEDN